MTVGELEAVFAQIKNKDIEVVAGRYSSDGYESRPVSTAKVKLMAWSSGYLTEVRIRDLGAPDEYRRDIAPRLDIC